MPIDTLRIWLVTVGEPLPLADAASARLMRTGTLALHLVNRGHEVVWWTSAFDHFGKRHHRRDDATAVWDGGTIRLLRSRGYRRNVSLGRVIEHATMARRFRTHVGSAQRPDIIVASLPTIDLAREAVRFARTRHVPVLVDVRDLWPDILLDALPSGLRWIGRVLLQPMFWDARYALRRCSGIVAVSDGYLEWALRHVGRPPGPHDAAIPLGYVPRPSSPSEMASAGHRLVSLGVDPSRTLCWYVGTFGKSYDLAPVLEAARALQHGGRRDLQFVICGEGDLGQQWRVRAAGLSNVVFTGWVNAHEINWLASHAAIGLQPYASGAPQGLSNKLFEYLAAGVPIVSSLGGETARLLADTGCGLTYRPGDATDCLQQISLLADDEGLRRAMGQKGRQLFHSRFDRVRVFDRYAHHVETVARRKARPH